MQPFAYLYNAERITRPGVIFVFSAPASDAVKSLSVRLLGGAFLGGGSLVLNLTKNGVSQLSGGDKLTLTAGQTTDESDGLNIELTKFDVLAVTVESAPAAGVSIPLQFQFEFEDAPVSGEAVEIDAGDFEILTGTDAQSLFDEIDIQIADFEDRISDLESAPGGASDLDGLSDVVLTSPAQNDILKHNGTNWINDTGKIPVNSQSAAYTLLITDGNGAVLHPASDNNARTFTIPANASVAFPTGTTIVFINRINTVTIAINSDTLILAGAGSTGSRTLAANGIATAVKIGATEWIISGTNLT